MFSGSARVDGCRIIDRVATLTERLTRLEVQVAQVSGQLEQVTDGLNGGGDVEYSRSVRGRLHHIENELTAATLTRTIRFRAVSRATQVALVVAALATAAAPYIVLALRR